MFMNGFASGGRKPAFAAATFAFCPRFCHDALTRASAPVKYGLCVSRTRANRAAECGTACSSICSCTSFASKTMPAFRKNAWSEHSTG